MYIELACRVLLGLILGEASVLQCRQVYIVKLNYYIFYLYNTHENHNMPFTHVQVKSYPACSKNCKQAGINGIEQLQLTTTD
jgi:hypothetical protein